VTVYVIAMVMWMDQSYKVASNQMIYTSESLCEAARVMLVERLKRSAPSNVDTAIMSKCIKLTEEDLMLTGDKV
jgi:hypothetical protein|tara:strand:- start:139 stop:360 length:222 start_codon:yes stop_codon:yes gene_type:complete